MAATLVRCEASTVPYGLSLTWTPGRYISTRVYLQISTPGYLHIYTDLLEPALHVQLDLGAVGPHQHVLAQPVEGVGLVVEGVDVGVSEHRGCNTDTSRSVMQHQSQVRVLVPPPGGRYPTQSWLALLSNLLFAR